MNTLANLVQFQEDRFFQGAVQLRWATERMELADQAAQAFVFHGPRYHAAGDAASVGIEGGYRLKDSASFVRDLLDSLAAGGQGDVSNPFWLAVAGYGSGKSHLALTVARLLGAPQSEAAAAVLTHLAEADSEIAAAVTRRLQQFGKPFLVIALDGMADFHLGNAVSRAVFQQLARHGVDASPIRALSPRFQTAEQFVVRNFITRQSEFVALLPKMTLEALVQALQEQDEAVYDAVNRLFLQANGSPIPIEGQESVQELLEALKCHYCGDNGVFSGVVILFDEFGRYLEYAAAKPHLAGDAALQQIFQGVQDQRDTVHFVGLIQYELKAYLQRFGSYDLRQLQRYLTRFEVAEKWYLSTNLETIFAHAIHKELAGVELLWRQSGAEASWQQCWKLMTQTLPGVMDHPVWGDADRFSAVIARGCWPLHPLATWFLTRQRDIVQSRSALRVIHDLLRKMADEPVINDNGKLRQISVSELVLHTMFSELLSAEREIGSSVFEYLQQLLERLDFLIKPAQRKILTAVALLEKMRVAKQPIDVVNQLLAEVSGVHGHDFDQALQALNDELGALEWNRDYGRYELIVDSTTRAQFQHWVRTHLKKIDQRMVGDLFLRRGALEGSLSGFNSDFGQSSQIATTEWRFEPLFAHSDNIGEVIARAFNEWASATLPSEPKGRVIYFYVAAHEDENALWQSVEQHLQQELIRRKQRALPIWVMVLFDQHGEMAEHLAHFLIFEEKISEEERERFRRFIPAELERSRDALKNLFESAQREQRDQFASLHPLTREGRQKRMADKLFKSVYPQAVPFPFDGFATSNGAGAADCAQLTRALITRQVEGNWIQTQPVRLKNRVNMLLNMSWQALLPSGQVCEPKQPNVAQLLDSLRQWHENDPDLSLEKSLQQLMAPPYGMNRSSAGVLFGLLLQVTEPACRLLREQNVEATVDWLEMAYAQRSNRHFLDEKLLRKTTLQFLSEDGFARWQKFLHNWEQEKNYVKQVGYLIEADKLQKNDPLPEVLEGNYKYRRDYARECQKNLLAARQQLDQWDNDCEQAIRQNKVDRMLFLAHKINKGIKQIDDEIELWSTEDIHQRSELVTQLRGEIELQINDWIPRQSCLEVVRVNDFLKKMNHAVDTLIELNFNVEAEQLERRKNQVILQIENRQRYSQTIAQAQNYPQLPPPTESTPVRELRDQIRSGNDLISSLEGMIQALGEDEVRAHQRAIRKAQDKFDQMLKHQLDGLSRIYEYELTDLGMIKQVLVQLNHYRNVFVQTPDADEIRTMMIQLEQVVTDVDCWESDALSPELLQTVLDNQITDQLSNLDEIWQQQNIEETIWDSEKIYRALLNERVNIALQKSAAWIKAQNTKVTQIKTMDITALTGFKKSLESPPTWVSKSDLYKIKLLQEEVSCYLEERKLNEQQCQFENWFSNCESEASSGVSEMVLENLIQQLSNPPLTLWLEAQQRVDKLLRQLTVQQDELNNEAIIARVLKLPKERQLSLLDDLLRIVHANKDGRDTINKGGYIEN